MPCDTGLWIFKFDSFVVLASPLSFFYSRPSPNSKARKLKLANCQRIPPSHKFLVCRRISPVDYVRVFYITRKQIYFLQYCPTHIHHSSAIYVDHARSQERIIQLRTSVDFLSRGARLNPVLHVWYNFLGGLVCGPLGGLARHPTGTLRIDYVNKHIRRNFYGISVYLYPD